MKKIKNFDDLQIQDIKSFLKTNNVNIALINCQHIGTYHSKMKCPECNKRWKRLPDTNTFKELTTLFEATDSAWSIIFGTDRSSVTRLRESINPKTKTPLWSQDRYEIEIESNNGFIDRKPIEDFLQLLQKYPSSKTETLLKIAGLNNEYFKLVLENDKETNDKFDTINNLQKTITNEYLFCSSCKIRKKNERFKKIGANKISAKVCKTCINERDRKKLLSESNQNNIVVYSCKKCGKKFEVNLSEDEDYVHCGEHK
jgi:hypothetical protein